LVRMGDGCPADLSEASAFPKYSLQGKKESQRRPKVRRVVHESTFRNTQLLVLRRCVVVDDCPVSTAAHTAVCGDLRDWLAVRDWLDVRLALFEERDDAFNVAEFVQRARCSKRGVPKFADPWFGRTDVCIWLAAVCVVTR
jgi:hypothetical protein